MYTLDQINEIHNRLGKQTTLPDYLQALNTIGIDKYESFITDGHSEYYGKDDYKVASPPVHEILTVANKSNKEAFLNHLRIHEQGRTSYLEMSKGLSDSGIEKWSFDTKKMTVIYYDMEGNEMLVEEI